MHILVNNGMLLLGPVPYNKKRFEAMIENDLEVDVTLPDTVATPYYDTEHQFSIHPVVATTQEEFSARTQFLNGPYWQYTEEGAIAEYRAEHLPLNAAKNMLKDRVAAVRYENEIAGADVEIRGQTVRAYTSREDRGVYIEAVQLAQDDEQEYNFKFMGAKFLAVNRLDLQMVITAVAAHIQAVFAWEAGLVQAIDACETHDQLELIDIGYPNA